MRDRGFIYSVAVLAATGAVVCLIGSVFAASAKRPIQAAGTWQSDSKGSGTWQAQLTLKGTRVAGEITFFDGNTAQDGLVEGVLTRDGFDLAISTATGQPFASFAALVNGPELSGVFARASGDRGRWSGSWFSAPPEVGPSWPAGVGVVPVPAMTEEWKPKLSGVRQFARRSSDETAPAGGSVAAVSVETNHLVNSDSSGEVQNEPEIGVDRVNLPDRMVVGANDYSMADGFSHAFHYFSVDRGVTWPYSGAIPGLAAYQASGDPVVDYDAAGRPFFAGVAYDDGDDLDDVIFVARSLNNGASFQSAYLVALGPAGTGVDVDKPWLVANKVAGTPGLNNVYVSWTRFAAGMASIRLAVSTNNGASFGSQRVVSDVAPGHGSTLAVGRDGKVNVVWRHNAQLLLDQCGPGSGACGTDRPVADIFPLPEVLPGTSWRMDTFPSLAIDPAVGANGVIYVVWPDYRNPIAGFENADIYFTRSIDNGASFLPPRPIANTYAHEFFPAISADANGFVRVIYYRTLTDGPASHFNVFEIFSADGGDTWSAPTQLNDGGDIQAVQFGGGFIGDYIGIDTRDYRHPAWMDSRRGQQDIYTTTVSGC